MRDATGLVPVLYNTYGRTRPNNTGTVDLPVQILFGMHEKYQPEYARYRMSYSSVYFYSSV